MGNYTGWSGEISFKPLKKKEWARISKEILVLEENPMEDVVQNVSSLEWGMMMIHFKTNKSGLVEGFICPRGDENFYDEDWRALLKKLTPFVKAGYIEVADEAAGEYWQYEFRAGKWFRDKGQITYEPGEPI